VVDQSSAFQQVSVEDDGRTVLCGVDSTNPHQAEVLIVGNTMRPCKEGGNSQWDEKGKRCPFNQVLRSTRGDAPFAHDGPLYGQGRRGCKEQARGVLHWRDQAILKKHVWEFGCGNWT